MLVALLLQQVLEYSPGIAGLAMLPTSLAGFAVSILVLPRALNRLGPQRVAVIGLVLLVVAHLLLATVDNGDSYVLRVLPALVVAATGVAFSFTPTTLVISEGIAARNSGVSSGLASATAQIGGAIGIAVFGASTPRAARPYSRRGHCTGGRRSRTAGCQHRGGHRGGVAAVIAVLTFPALRSALTGRQRPVKADAGS